jgi:hypothetical protein
MVFIECIDTDVGTQRCDDYQQQRCYTDITARSDCGAGAKKDADG